MQLAIQWYSEDFQGKKSEICGALLKRARDERTEGLELVPEILRGLTRTIWATYPRLASSASSLAYKGRDLKAR
jgi:hypothetical protein